MADKSFNVRVINKHDTETNWLKATNFIPKQGEIIVYDKDSNYSYERFKIGDGATNVNSLPFATDHIEDLIDTEIAAVTDLIGDTSVSDQITEAIANSGAVLYTEQTLTDEQRAQAQENIGFGDEDALELSAELGLIDPVAADDGSIYTDENGVLYSL